MEEIRNKIMGDMVNKIEQEVRKEAVDEMQSFGHPNFYKIVKEVEKLHSDKNSDYATKQEPLGNFVRVANKCEGIITPGLTATKVCYIYLMKQIDAVGKLLAAGEIGKMETIMDKCNDIAVYAIILRILYEEGK